MASPDEELKEGNESDQQEGPACESPVDIRQDAILQRVRENVKVAMQRGDLKGLKGSITEGDRCFVIDRNGNPIEIWNDQEDDAISDNKLKTGTELLPPEMKALQDISPEVYFRTSQYVYFDLLRFSISPPPCTILDLRWKSGDEMSTIFGHRIRSRSGEEISGAEYVLRAAHALGVIPKDKSSINTTEAMETLRLLKMIARRSGNWSEEDVNKAHRYRGPKPAQSPKAQPATQQPETTSERRQESGAERAEAQAPTPPQSAPETTAPGLDLLRAQQTAKGFDSALQKAKDTLAGLQLDSIGDVHEARRQLTNVQRALDDLQARMEDMRRLRIPFNEGEVEGVMEQMQDLFVQLEQLPAKLRKAMRQKEREEWMTLLTRQGADMQKQIEEMRAAMAQKIQEQHDLLQKKVDEDRKARAPKPAATPAATKVNTAIWSNPVKRRPLKDVVAGMWSRPWDGSARLQMRRTILTARGLAPEVLNPTAGQVSSPSQPEQTPVAPVTKPVSDTKTASKAQKPQQEAAKPSSSTPSSKADVPGAHATTA